MTQSETGAAYDALAPFYRDYAQGRSAYLGAVDRFILDHAPRGTAALLDVGAGDGVRGMALAQGLGIGRVVLCEPSVEMAARCRALAPSDVWLVAAEQLPETGERFDVILCLWNVLGHLPDRASRMAALSGMKRLLAEGGRIFFDVNNRHNASSYGWCRVTGRILLDALAPDERRGDAVFEWYIDGHTFPGCGHLFTPAEIERIIHESGLHIDQRVAINYANGAPSRSPLRGQLLYQVCR